MPRRLLQRHLLHLHTLCLLVHRHRRRPARLQVCSFVFGAMNLIDLAAILLLFWITLIMSAAGIQGDVGLGFLRVIRLLRVFRIFKFGRVLMGVQMFAVPWTMVLRT